MKTTKNSCFFADLREDQSVPVFDETAVKRLFAAEVRYLCAIGISNFYIAGDTPYCYLFAAIVNLQVKKGRANIICVIPEAGYSGSSLHTKISCMSQSAIIRQDMNGIEDICGTFFIVSDDEDALYSIRGKLLHYRAVHLLHTELELYLSEVYTQRYTIDGDIRNYYMFLKEEYLSKLDYCHAYKQNRLLAGDSGPDDDCDYDDFEIDGRKMYHEEKLLAGKLAVEIKQVKSLIKSENQEHIKAYMDFVLTSMKLYGPVKFNSTGGYEIARAEHETAYERMKALGIGFMYSDKDFLWDMRHGGIEFGGQDSQQVIYKQIGAADMDA